MKVVRQHGWGHQNKAFFLSKQLVLERGINLHYKNANRIKYRLRYRLALFSGAVSLRRYITLSNTKRFERKDALFW